MPGRTRNGYHRASEAEHLAREELRTFQCALTTLGVSFALILAGIIVMFRADYGHVKAHMVDEYNRGSSNPTVSAPPLSALLRATPPLVSDLLSLPPSSPSLLPPPAAVDAWNAGDAFPFNVTSFVLEYDGFEISAESTDATPPLDTAGGSVHAYNSVAYTVDSLMERAAIPSMIAAGVLPPDGVPSLADLSSRASAPRDDEDGDAPSVEPAYNLSAIMAHITTPRELFLVATGPAPGNAEPRRASLGSFALATKRESRSNGWKACKYQHSGAYAAGMCTTYAALEEICVKVRRNDDGAWGADDAFGGVGCDPNTRWEPAKWRRVRAPGVGKDPAFSTTRSAGRGAVVVRSGSDPLIAARNITGGSMFFAEVEAGRSAAGTIMLIVGFVVAAPGAMLAWPFASRAAKGAAVFRLGRAARTRRATDPDAFDNIL